MEDTEDRSNNFHLLVGLDEGERHLLQSRRVCNVLHVIQQSCANLDLEVVVQQLQECSEAFQALTNGTGSTSGTIEADAVQVNASVCGL